MLKAKSITLPNGKTVPVKRSKTPLIIVVLLICCYYSVQITGFNLQVLTKRIGQFWVILVDMVPPNWDYISKLWKPLFDTIKMSLLGSILGAVFALPLAYFASSNMSKNKTVVVATKFILSLLRTLPTLVAALIATFIFGIGTTAGTIAIFIFTIAYIGKLLYEQIENADLKAFEAMQSMGHSTVSAFRYAIIPQILPNYLSNAIFCFEGNVRYAAILGYVGAGGIGLMLNESLGWRNYANVGMILLLLAATVFIIETISEYIRKKLL
ncbi:phosphonate ABC transporter, permease protein PhnE [Sporosarcina sp. BI001-red]|uniref:phosphonate ABC transporter, permease protein PhnE n=1 Tax=Sporosarcina sp. BI001-red TaxID=2282866 RepID=UPI000E27EDC3|nr:phosphonate ABC transporter, permease protein PhnE [Sporosarcina sp. BI001-red]REB07464.1 phosphonate ABC transporter, permease protein PhnE [Sporosarcina sp. BI001-red]